MAAITSSSQIRFFPLKKMDAIESEDFCGICFENFLQNNKQNRTPTESCWNTRVILVHTNNKTQKGYSCQVHRDCLQGWLANNHPFCPFCRSAVNPLDDSVYTFKDKAIRVIEDGASGALLMGKVSIFFLSYTVGSTLSITKNPLLIYKVIGQLAVSQKVQQIVLLLLTTGAAASIAVRYIQRKGWFFKNIPF